jgi:hypothetical protein
VTANITKKFADPIAEGTTPRYEATLLDPGGTPIPAIDMTTLTLTLYDSVTHAVVNSVQDVNILNAGRGTFDALGNLAITLTTGDTAILDDTKRSEKRVMLIEWVAGSITGRHEVVFKIKNMVLVP